MAHFPAENPSLEGDEGQHPAKNRIFSISETKTQIHLALPLIITNVSFFLIPMISVMFSGRNNTLHLAGATLAYSWAYVSGFTFLMGLSCALDTLCGQAFGSLQHSRLGLYLQSSSIISSFFSIVISAIWFLSEPILLSLKQDPQISRNASLFLKYLIPGVIAYGFVQNIMRFLQAQSIVLHLMIIAILSVAFHVALCFTMVNFSGLGFVAAPLAASVSFWVAAFALMMFVKMSGKVKETWCGLSWDCLKYVVATLKLALPSAGMVCLEGLAFDILVILAGLMPDSQKTTSVIAICVNTAAICYMISFGLSAVASTRVSNEIGANNPSEAKRAVITTVSFAILCSFTINIILIVAHNSWSGLFTTSNDIKKSFASLTPLLIASITLDSVQGVLIGVVRGCGWQAIAFCTNILAFYFVGLSVAVVLAFVKKLYVKGLWIGLLCGLFSQVCVLLMLSLFLKWEKRKIQIDSKVEVQMAPIE